MFHQRTNSLKSNKPDWGWIILCFNGGFINSGGFLATGKFVSHITGFATLFGVDAITGQLLAAFQVLSVPFYFLVGAFIAGYLIEGKLDRQEKPRFDLVMFTAAICLFLCVAWGYIFFDFFGQTFKLNRNYVILSLLCLSCGLQNAALSFASGTSLRTTHMTGLTTDLGLGLAKLLRQFKSRGNSTETLLENQWRSLAIASFIFGSSLGAGLFILFGYNGFFIPALICLAAATYDWWSRNER